MTLHPHDALALPDGGKLILTPCPGTKGAALAESIAQLREADADAVISMTPSDELNRLGVSALPEAVARASTLIEMHPLTLKKTDPPSAR